MSDEKMPEYSVLMSVYVKDDPGFLNEAIESMVAQTVPFCELVLMCDGPLTPDLDSAIALWEQRLGARMRAIRIAKNGGLGAALAAGVPACACDVVARMDSDDISRPDRMEKLLRKMTSEGLDLVGGAIEEFDKKPGDMGSVRMPPLEGPAIRERLRSRNPFNHVSVVYDRHAVERAGGYESLPWMEDYWLWARMIKDGCRCANIPDVVVDVRTGEGMYARRSNTAYLKSQVRFFGELRRLGLISRTDQAKAVVQRTLATILPTGLVKLAYNKMLRQRGRQ